MDSMDLEVLQAAIRWHRDGRRAILGTVVRTWGSAPRPVGAMVAVRDDGRIAGSVSGGCVEDDIVERMRAGEFGFGAPQVVTYGVLADEAHRFGLPCGGTLQLVFEPLGDASRLPELLDAIDTYRSVVRKLDMRTGAVELAPGDSGAALQFDGRTLVSAHGARHRLLVIGAGQITRHLAAMAMALDYEVTVCDPRQEYADEWRMPGVTLTREMPDDVVIAMAPDPHMAIVALTHDPKLDDMALLEALRCRAFYVGAIGSRANQARRRERLRLFDLEDAELDRLHGPVGLHIGARTPPEIAVSIIAEMTAARNGVSIIQTHAIRSPASDEDKATGNNCAIA
jgi:xanthine dehydrogenase accessory factor